MAQGTIAPSPIFTGLDNNALIVPGGLLYTYEAGTTTKATTYSEYTLTTPNTNPIVLDAAGRATIFLPQSGASFKYVLSYADDTDPPTHPIWTQDNISPIPASSGSNQAVISGIAGEAMAIGVTAYLSRGDGSKTAGYWYKLDDAADYSSVTADAIGIMSTASMAAGDSVSIVLAGSVQPDPSAGISAGDVVYASSTAGQLTNTAPASNIRAVGAAWADTIISMAPWVKGKGLRTILPLSAGLEMSGPLQVDGVLRFQTSSTSGEFSKPSGVINFNGTPVTSGAGVTDLMSYTLPANTMSRDLIVIRVAAFFTCTNNVDSKGTKFYWGGVDLTLAGSFPVNIAGALSQEFLIIRTAAGAQTVAIRNLCSASNSTGGSIYLVTATTTATADETTALEIKFTGGDAGGATGEVVQTMMSIEVLN